MLNTRRKEPNTVFYSYLACFMNTFILNMYVLLSSTGWTRRNTSFVFLWLRPRNTWLPIQHVGWRYTSKHTSYVLYWPLQEIRFSWVFCARVKSSVRFFIGVCARVSHPCIAPPPKLYCPHYCNTIARPLCNVRLPPVPPFVCHTLNNISNDNIVQGQVAPQASGGREPLYIYTYIYTYINDIYICVCVCVCVCACAYTYIHIYT